MFINVYSISIFISICFLLAVIELVRKNKLQERYSILWIVMSIALLVVASSPYFVNKLAFMIDIKNPPSLLFLFGLIYLLFYNLHTTTVMSKQIDRITRLTQEISLLKEKQNESGN